MTIIQCVNHTQQEFQPPLADGVWSMFPGRIEWPLCLDCKGRLAGMGIHFVPVEAGSLYDAVAAQQKESHGPSHPQH